MFRARSSRRVIPSPWIPVRVDAPENHDLIFCHGVNHVETKVFHASASQVATRDLVLGRVLDDSNEDRLRFLEETLTQTGAEHSVAVSRLNDVELSVRADCKCSAHLSRERSVFKTSCNGIELLGSA